MHAREYPAGSLKVVEQIQMGYNLDRKYHCNVYNQIHKMCTDLKPDSNVKQSEVLSQGRSIQL